MTTGDTWTEEDGNLLRSDRRETGFDSRGPDGGQEAIAACTPRPGLPRFLSNGNEGDG